MIKELRNQLGLSQREFGRKIGKTGSYISQVESGRIKLSPENAKKIEKAFGNIRAEGTTAERLRLARKKRQFSQQELAKAAKCSRNTISLAESGKTTLTASTISRISEILWIDEDWLRFGSGSMERSEMLAEILEIIHSDPDIRKAVELSLKKQ